MATTRPAANERHDDVAEAPGTGAAELDALAARKAREILALLSAPHHWLRSPGDPELRSVLGRFYSRLAEVRRLCDAAGPRLGDTPSARLRELVDNDFGKLRLEGAVEVVDSLDLLLIEVGDERYVCEQLELELQREQRPDQTTPVVWGDLFGADQLGKSIEALDDDGTSAKTATSAIARRRLRTLYRARSDRFRILRARARMRRRYLFLLAPILLGLLVAFAAAISVAGSEISGSELVLASLAGALGGTLSGFLKLRDKLVRIWDMRAFAPALFVQPLVGGVAGLVMLLFIASGTLGLSAGENAPWSAIGLLGFVAGFSEPFFLGLVQRVATPSER